MKKLTDFPDAHLRVFDRPPVPAPDDVRDVYLIGICGTGMGSLAGLFREAGHDVRGSDQAAYPPMSLRLAAMDIPVYEGFDGDRLRGASVPDLVIVGNACLPTHPEAAAAREEGLAQQSLPEAVAHFFIRNRRSLVVAGTHGKTTTTGLLVHVFREAGRDPGFLLGGVMSGTDLSYAVGAGRHFIVEGDEYDSAYFDKRPKFMHYRPTSAIVTSMEFDHADIYDAFEDYRQAFRAFVAIVDPQGLLVLCGDRPAVRHLAEHTQARVRFYGLGPDNHITARDVRSTPEGQHFRLAVRGKAIGELFLPMSGEHNLLNALAVCAVGLDEGLTPDELAAGLATFKGLKRRQEVRGTVGDVTVVDDFAHHPTAVHATIRAIKQRWPDARLIAVFEPRSNSSRRKVFEQDYIRAFGGADLLFLSTPPLRHNDSPDALMDADAVADAVERSGTRVVLGADADDLLPPLLEAVRPGDVVLIMSNGGFGNIHNRLLDALHATEPTRVS